MAQPTTIHIALAPEAKAQLDALAAATRRPAEHLAAEAIGEYLTTNRHQVTAIREGLSAAERGELVDLAELRQHLEAQAARQTDGARQ